MLGGTGASVTGLSRLGSASLPPQGARQPAWLQASPPASADPCPPGGPRLLSSALTLLEALSGWRLPALDSAGRRGVFLAGPAARCALCAGPAGRWAAAAPGPRAGLPPGERPGPSRPPASPLRPRRLRLGPFEASQRELRWPLRPLPGTSLGRDLERRPQSLGDAAGFAAPSGVHGADGSLHPARPPQLGDGPRAPGLGSVLRSGAGHTCSLLVFEECDPTPPLSRGPAASPGLAPGGRCFPSPSPGAFPPRPECSVFISRLSLHRFCWLAWGRPRPDPPILSPFPANCC